MQPGDRLLFRTAGAGGWGDPLLRDPAIVERDVRRRLVSKEAAAELYGVVVGDAAATGHFSIGSGTRTSACLSTSSMCEPVLMMVSGRMPSAIR